MKRYNAAPNTPPKNNVVYKRAPSLNVIDKALPEAPMNRETFGEPMPDF